MIRRKFITAEDKTVMSGMGSGVIWLRRVKADLPAAEFRKRYVVPFINKKGKESNGRDHNYEKATVKEIFSQFQFQN